jgi:predicted dehydrogenase
LAGADSARKNCVKPLALTVEQADELVGLARRQDRLLVANLMQRYNPLFDIVGQVIDRQPLGEFLHGYFENYASDENLPPEHWFWDPEKSGGIFVEHGVHFFDMLTGWLGAGEVVSAQASRRSDGCEDQVQCTVRYPGGAHFNFYHGFHQPGRLDRQEHLHAAARARRRGRLPCARRASPRRRPSGAARASRRR